MNEQRPGRSGIVVILNALVWAAAMLAAAYVFKNEPWSKEMTLWLIAGFLAFHGLLAARVSRRRCGD